MTKFAAMHEMKTWRDVRLARVICDTTQCANVVSLSTVSALSLLFVVVCTLGCNLHPGRSASATKRNATVESNDAGVCVADLDTLNEPPIPAGVSPNENAVGVMAPRTIYDVPSDFWDVTLDEVIHQALRNSDVIRDVGGRVLVSPESLPTKYDPGIEYTDPQFGVEAALSAFDTNLSSQFSYANNDRVFNNLTLGAGAQELRQDLASLRTELSKVAATGTQMTLRSNIGHDRNNRAGNLFGHLWETQYEAELRQPLLQGAGVAFNRIGGPAARPGLRFTNGVVIAQMNNDISKVDFELAVRGFVSDITEAFWQLHEAYYDFNAKQATRVAAERTWKAVEAKFDRGLVGGEADKEAQARAQFFLYQDLSIEALNGSPTSPGVYESERMLRSLMGLPVNDGRLLRPIEEISDARVIYDWASLSDQAVTRRAEIRRQRWVVKQEELRLVAAKHFILPRLDATALYRIRGFGDDLAGNGDVRFGSALDDVANLDHQEWEIGLQFNVPIGRRRAYAGVRHAELRLSRERSILREQELQVSHELGNAIARAAQTHGSMSAGYERMLATQQRVAATNASFEAGKTPVDLLLDAQERLATAESRYFALVTQHAIAAKDVQLASGNLLSTAGIRLEGDSPLVFYSKQNKRRDELDYRYQLPGPTSIGEHSQEPSFITPLPVVE